MIQSFKTFNPDDYEDIVNPTERFIVKVNDFKQSAGLWYTLFAKKILPFIIFIIPINVIIGRVNHRLSPLLPGVDLFGTIMLVMWIIAMLGFVAVTIFLPRVATVLEFVLGSAYLFLAFRHHLFNNLLGYSVLIGMITFLFVKLVFLIFEIIRIRAFSGDKKNNIERDESGRVVRASNEDVIFLKGDPYAGKETAVAMTDEMVYFAADDSGNNEPAVQIDEQLVFASADAYDDDDTPVAADDDFIIG